MEENKGLSWAISNFVWFILARILPKKWYLSLRYHLLYGRWINWKRPQYFTEKLQWLKVYGYGKKETVLVDKVLVKDFVKSKIGEQYVIPTYQVWDDPSKMTFSSLPEQFVLKCNHDSGSIIICNDKKELDIRETKSKLSKIFHTNYYWMGRETPYKYVKRKVFAEKRISSVFGKELMDYKFFCFNGEPKIFKVDFERFVDHHANYYDIQQNLLPFGETWPPPMPSKVIEMPENFEEMVNIAKKLSEGLPFVRIDLYNNDGEIYFGEVTLFPTSGFGSFTDDEWDKKLGEWLILPAK